VKLKLWAPIMSAVENWRMSLGKLKFIIPNFL